MYEIVGIGIFFDTGLYPNLPYTITNTVDYVYQINKYIDINEKVNVRLNMFQSQLPGAEYLHARPASREI